MINVCIPVLNNYDGLSKCITSIHNSTISVDNVYVVDNGGRFENVWGEWVKVHTPVTNLGVAGSWNYFIEHTSAPRIICNDDIVFESDAIEEMCKASDENPNSLIFPTGVENVNSFSCFLLPQKVISVVGLFDEKISPKYAYFEDNDYHRRMLLYRCDILPCAAKVHHEGSKTLKNYDANSIRRHHEKFKIAENNYIRKWGGKPGQETLMEPREL